MNTTAILSVGTTDSPAPKMDIDRAIDGDVVFRFRDYTGSSISVVMLPEQFKTFMSQGDDFRNAMLLSEMAAERERANAEEKESSEAAGEEEGKAEARAATG